MFRRIVPTLLILICVTLDSTLIPIIYRGTYSVPLTVVAVLSIGMVMGRMQGLLYGTFAGLLLDITTGTLGMMTFFLMAIGFMIGLILNASVNQPQPTRRRQRRRILWPSVWIAALYAAGELVFLFIQYFNTAEMQWIYILNILIRAAICTALVMLLNPTMEILLLGPVSSRNTNPRQREVKRF